MAQGDTDGLRRWCYRPDYLFHDSCHNSDWKQDWVCQKLLREWEEANDVVRLVKKQDYLLFSSMHFSLHLDQLTDRVPEWLWKHLNQPTAFIFCLVKNHFLASNPNFAANWFILSLEKKRWKSNGRRIRLEVRNPVYEPEIKQALDPHIYLILLPEKTGYRSGNCLLKQFSSGKRLRQHF